VHRPITLLLAFAAAAAADTGLVNTGKPMRVPFECTADDTQAAGLSCSDEEPCPVYLELASVEVAGNRIFLPGNLHTPAATLYSMLLASEDGGSTWTEPFARLRSSGLDQVQFVDFQNGWISGANLQGAPRDPFLLITTDGGKTWRQRPIFEESRVASVERFWFDTREEGAMLVDARLDDGRRELYETRTGGESWALQQASSGPIAFPRTREPGASGWRVRVDAATHSFALEKSQGEQWTRIASFLVDAGACKQ
jgi:photosystem II stability/assembly factor-like uncharacterized protein